MEESCRKCAPNARLTPLINLVNNPKQLFHARNYFKNKTDALMNFCYMFPGMYTHKVTKFLHSSYFLKKYRSSNQKCRSSH